MCFGKEILCFAMAASFALPAMAQADSAQNLPNFLLPSFTKSIVKLKSGSLKSAVINYNVVDQEMVFLQNDVYMVLDDPQQIDTIYISSRKFIPFKKGFYEVIESGGPVSLFIQHKIIADPPGTTTGYGVTSQTATPSYIRQIYGPMGSVDLRLPEGYKLTDATEYLFNKDNIPEKCSSKRQFLKIFRTKEKELNEFINTNNINFKRLSDLIRLINYCNELYAKT